MLPRLAEDIKITVNSVKKEKLPGLEFVQPCVFPSTATTAILFPILLLFSSRFLCIFSPLFLYFLSSSSLPKPSTDSYNIYDCLEHTLAAENWRAYIAIFIPILTAFLLSDFLFHRTELHQLSGGSDLLQTRSGENVVWSRRQIFLLPM